MSKKRRITPRIRPVDEIDELQTLLEQNQSKILAPYKSTMQESVATGFYRYAVSQLARESVQNFFIRLTSYICEDSEPSPDKLLKSTLAKKIAKLVEEAHIVEIPEDAQESAVAHHRKNKGSRTP